MSNYVVILSESEIARVKETYKGGETTGLPPGAVWRYRNASLTITIYRSRKVMFQGARAEAEGARWGNTGSTRTAGGARASKSSGAKKPISFGTGDWNQHRTIGSDEVGTGDFFGGINVASAFVTPEDAVWLQSLGVTDSKAMTDDVIRRIAPQIRARIPHREVVIDMESYNRGISKGWNQGKIKGYAHHRAQRELLASLRPEGVRYVVIDQFAAPNVYNRYIAGQPPLGLVEGEEFVSMTKAESQVVAVACASVIARDRFLTIFDRMGEAFGCTFPKGAGRHVDTFGRAWVKKHGLDALGQVAKLHFANTERVKG
ncbi:MAG: ribonuclease HIII [Bacilli bacterium]